MEKLMELSEMFYQKKGIFNHLISSILWIPVIIYAAYLEHRINKFR